jgi:hypothetical protein
MSEKEIMPVVTEEQITEWCCAHKYYSSDAPEKAQRDAGLAVYQAREEYHKKLISELVEQTRREVTRRNGWRGSVK